MSLRCPRLLSVVLQDVYNASAKRLVGKMFLWRFPARAVTLSFCDVAKPVRVHNQVVGSGFGTQNWSGKSFFPCGRVRSRLHRQDDSICFLPGSVKLSHFGVLFRCNSVFKFRRGRSLGGVFLVARLGGFDPQLLFLLNWLNGLFHQFFIKDLLNNLLALDGCNLWRHAARLRMAVARDSLREHVSGRVWLVILCFFFDLVFVDFFELRSLRWWFHIFGYERDLVALNFSRNVISLAKNKVGGRMIIVAWVDHACVLEGAVDGSDRRGVCSALRAVTSALGSTLTLEVAVAALRHDWAERVGMSFYRGDSSPTCGLHVLFPPEIFVELLLG